MTGWKQTFANAHQSSVWRHFRDSVSFSWHAICKTDCTVKCCTNNIPSANTDSLDGTKGFINIYAKQVKSIPSRKCLEMNAVHYRHSSLLVLCIKSKEFSFLDLTEYVRKREAETFHCLREINSRALICTAWKSRRPFFLSNGRMDQEILCCASMCMMKLTTTDCRSRKTFSGRKVTSGEREREKKKEHLNHLLGW